MNLPKRAEDAHAALAAAFNTRQLDIVLSMYDTEGIIVPEPGKPVSGNDHFKEAINSILSIEGKMEIKTVHCLQTGNIAVGRSEWSITEGQEVRVRAGGIEVMRQQADGTWKIVIDHAFGAEANLVG